MDDKVQELEDKIAQVRLLLRARPTSFFGFSAQAHYKKELKSLKEQLVILEYNTQKLNEGA